MKLDMFEGLLLCPTERRSARLSPPPCGLRTLSCSIINVNCWKPFRSECLHVFVRRLTVSGRRLVGEWRVM